MDQVFELAYHPMAVDSNLQRKWLRSDTLPYAKDTSQALVPTNCSPVSCVVKDQCCGPAAVKKKCCRIGIEGSKVNRLICGKRRNRNSKLATLDLSRTAQHLLDGHNLTCAFFQATVNSPIMSAGDETWVAGGTARETGAGNHDHEAQRETELQVGYLSCSNA